MATFLENEMNSAGRDMMGRKAHLQIMFPVKDKTCRLFEDIFFRM